MLVVWRRSTVANPAMSQPSALAMRRKSPVAVWKGHWWRTNWKLKSASSLLQDLLRNYSTINKSQFRSSRIQQLQYSYSVNFPGSTDRTHRALRTKCVARKLESHQNVWLDERFGSSTWANPPLHVPWPHRRLGSIASRRFRGLALWHSSHHHRW